MRGWPNSTLKDRRARRRINITQFEIANNSLDRPSGRMAGRALSQGAFSHGGGVVLLILRSLGYSLMWPSHLGTQPYENGFGAQVVRVDWAPGSVFSPPPNWFHQHFNTGPERA